MINLEDITIDLRQFGKRYYSITVLPPPELEHWQTFAILSYLLENEEWVNGPNNDNFFIVAYCDDSQNKLNGSVNKFFLFAPQSKESLIAKLLDPRLPIILNQGLVRFQHPNAKHSGCLSDPNSSIQQTYRLQWDKFKIRQIYTLPEGLIPKLPK